MATYIYSAYVYCNSTTSQSYTTNPVAGASVVVGSSTYYTDKNGLFYFTNSSASVSATISRGGCTSRTVTLTSGTTSVVLASTGKIATENDVASLRGSTFSQSSSAHCPTYSSISSGGGSISSVNCKSRSAYGSTQCVLLSDISFRNSTNGDNISNLLSVTYVTTGTTLVVAGASTPLTSICKVYIDGVLQSSVSSAYTIAAGTHVVKYATSGTTVPEYLCQGANTNRAGGRVTTAYIPSTYTTIGSQAFYDCSIATITGGNSITTVNSSAFENATYLTSAGNILIYCQTYYSSAFAGCTSLTASTSTNIKGTLDTQTFYNCSSLNCVASTAITYIGAQAFMGAKLYRANVGVTRSDGIGASAFRGCTATTVEWLTSVAIPSYCFASAYTPTVTITTQPNSWGSYAFYHNHGLTTFSLGNFNLSSFGDYCFAGCNADGSAAMNWSISRSLTSATTVTLSNTNYPFGNTTSASGSQYTGYGNNYAKTLTVNGGIYSGAWTTRLCSSSYGGFNLKGQSSSSTPVY